MKENSNSVPDNFFVQSGVLPFRKLNGKIEILLITSREKKKWIFPKGVVESELGKKASASKEAFEEAGIIGKIGKNSIGEFTNNKWGGLCRVIIYPMEVSNVLKHWEEESFRKRKWFTISEIKDAVSSKKIRKIVDIFIKSARHKK